MAVQSSGQIDTVMQEKRLFPPPKKFAGVAHSLDRAPSPRRVRSS